MREVLRVAFAVLAKDARVELRSRIGFQSAAVFAVLVLVIFNFARDPATVTTDVLAPSVLWVTVTFAGVIAMNRSFALELGHGAIDGLLLAPVSRSALFLGKYLANLAFVLLVEALTLPLFVLFFNVEITVGLLGVAGLLALATTGFVAIGTLLAAMTVRTRFAELMLPVLVLPFLVPPVLVGVQATTRLLAGRPLGEIAGWFRFLGLYALAFIVLTLLLFPAVMDE